MKKSVLVATLLIVSFCSFAQNNYVPPAKPYKVLVSVFAGPTLDWVQPSTVNYALVSPSLGARVGIPVDINLTDEENYYFSTGVHMKFDNTLLTFPEQYPFQNYIDTVITTRNYSAFYLTIPTGIKLKTNTFGKSVVGLNLGLYHSFFISGKTYDSFKINTLSSDQYSVATNRKDNVYSAMFKESLYAGIGYEYRIKSNLRAYAYANYVFTFTNYFRLDSFNSVSGLKESAITQGVELIVGIGL